MAEPLSAGCACGCTDPRGSAVHPVCVALAVGDLDRAFGLGLMDVAPCPVCSVDCVALLGRVQQDRRLAMAARGRFRQREARLTRLRAEREQLRSVAAAGRLAGSASPAPSNPNPALPPAAAAALARAREKAAARSQGATWPPKNVEP